jgi:gluconokinase
MRCFVIMGVSGCGKSSVGAAVAAAIGAGFIDGDDLHPDDNIAKMARGEPLTDADRAPWLDRVGQALHDAPGRCIIGCSALKRSYRDRIAAAAGEPVMFLHLSGNRDVLLARMSRRQGHFMPVSLLDSQLATLEPLQDDECFARTDIDQPFEAVVSNLVEKIRNANAGA